MISMRRIMRDTAEHVLPQDLKRNWIVKEKRKIAKVNKRTVTTF